MNLLEYTESYISNAFDDVKDMTHKFNQLDLEDRKDFLEELKSFDKVNYDDFIEKIRKQAVLDFWTEERELIKQGKCTREWTAEQIEYIMNISTKSGDASINGGKAIVLDKSGNPVMKTHNGNLINEVYEGHHMLNVHDHPEYAGDYRNIQALARSNGEHLAAHGGDFHNETDQYYDVNYHNETGQYDDANEGLSKIDNANGEVDFEEFWESKRKQCIFKSDADMENMQMNIGRNNKSFRQKRTAYKVQPVLN